MAGSAPVRAPRARRLAALALVALYVATALAALVHQADVRHVVCAEHGELIDVPAAGALAAATTGGAAVASASDDDDDDDDGLGARNRADALAAHDHCALAAVDDDALAPALPTAAPVARPVAAVAAAAAPAPAPHPADPLTVAPKTSPPS